MADRIEDTLNGGFGGLYGEVVTCDCYRLHNITWQPDIIIDMGGNVGVFSRFARTLFPEALIVAVEPDIDNYNNFKKFTSDDNLILLNKAIGAGPIWRCIGAVNGARECYFSDGLGYDTAGMDAATDMERVKVDAVLPGELINEYVKPGMRAIVKIDIEGNENSFLNDKPSMDALHRMDYIAMEIHKFALTHEFIDAVRDRTDEMIDSFRPTHTVELEHVMFYATKK